MTGQALPGKFACPESDWFEGYVGDLKRDLEEIAYRLPRIGFRRRRYRRPVWVTASRALSVIKALDDVTRSDGPMVSAARGIGGGPGSEPSSGRSDRATAPRPLGTTRVAAEREIAGALKCCIDAHGPITSEWIGSASKRVASAIGVRT